MKKNTINLLVSGLMAVLTTIILTGVLMHYHETNHTASTSQIVGLVWVGFMGYGYSVICFSVYLLNRGISEFGVTAGHSVNVPSSVPKAGQL
jgi:drug/metabolite transporter (DMT)-like permease